MNETKRAQTVRYFAEQIARLEKQSAALTADDRADEAVFAKVQRNIYDIFQTIFSVAVQNAGADDAKAVRFFLTKIQQIPESWRTALTLARQHGETEKAHIEQCKLDTASDIQRAFAEIWEVTP